MNEPKLRVIDFNKLLLNRRLFDKISSLNLVSTSELSSIFISGSSQELKALEKLSAQRRVDAKIIVATNKGAILGWALMSRENSSFKFARQNGFNPNKDGTLFQIYVKKMYRRTGIGKQIVNLALNIKESNQICFCPWDFRSESFFRQFKSKDIKFI